MAKFLVRVVSAALGVLLLIGLFWFFGAYGLLAITSLVIFLSAFELSNILFSQSHAKGRIFQPIFVSTTALGFGSLVFSPSYGPALFSILVLIYCLLLIVHLRNLRSQVILFEIAFSVLGLIYLPHLTHYAGRVLLMDNGPFWFAYLLAIPFAGDTMAYFIGKGFGTRKLLPTISPKKTVQGALGGILGSVIASSSLFFFIEHPYSWTFPLLGAVVGAFAQIGDFFESLIKRSAQVKDSGHLMPGHGGLLDRIDGVIFACPVLYMYVYFLDSFS